MKKALEIYQQEIDAKRYEFGGGFDESAALQELTVYTRGLLSRVNHKERALSQGISFYRTGASEFSIDINKMGNGYIHLNLFTKVEVSSRSLADPRANYQTTSARVVKNKKTQFRELYDNVDKAKKKIATFVSKLPN
jgi:hypothetical protein